MYLSLKTSELKDKKIKEKFDEYYINSSYLSVFDFSIREFLDYSDNKNFSQCLKSPNLDTAIKECEKNFLKFHKKFLNLFKILSCIFISNYKNRENPKWEENTFEYEVNKMKTIFDKFLSESEIYLLEDKDISKIHEKYYDEIMDIAEYIDNVLKYFENTYKNEEGVKGELDYLFWEFYNLKRLLNLLKIAKKHNLELVYS